MPHQKVPAQWGFHFSKVQKVGWRVWFDSPIFYLFNLTMYSWVTSFDRLASNKRTKQFWVPNFAYNSSMSSSPIPVDLFVSKKHPGLTGGDLGFADASGNVTFRLNRHSSPKNKRLFLDSTGNPLISIYRYRVSLSLFWFCF